MFPCAETSGGGSLRVPVRGFYSVFLCVQRMQTGSLSLSLSLSLSARLKKVDGGELLWDLYRAGTARPCVNVFVDEKRGEWGCGFYRELKELLHVG